ncbi:hypothetical protein CHELA40_10876 [Chelatococcus asaccharovorans]|nr:hypothetical protein CHELA40_10876 [Chelatococcus asaccharovorans]CAH1685873.1 hypothetical protein CHELA17_64724 [Chelatococcus asaccharovorans]
MQPQNELNINVLHWLMEVSADGACAMELGFVIHLRVASRVGLKWEIGRALRPVPGAALTHRDLAGEAGGARLGI